MVETAVRDPRRQSVYARLRLITSTGLAALGATLALGALLAAPAPATTIEPGPVLGTADPSLINAGKKQRNKLFDETLAAGIRTVRFNAFWYVIAPSRPSNPTNPGDPAYKFDKLDKAIREADSRGLDTYITLQRAPEWAESEPNKEDRGAYKPEIDAFADYSHAVATRYSGSFDPDGLGPRQPLPRVERYQTWNECNLEKFLAPQFERGEPFAPDYCRRLINSGYAALKAVDPGIDVIFPGTAPIGPTAKTRIEPEEFLREIFCLKNNLEPRPAASCLANGPQFDIYDHHPIAVKQPPSRPGRDGNVLIADYRKLKKIVRAAEAAGSASNIGPPEAAPRPLWASEMYWETNPPETKRGFPERRVARFVAEGIKLLHEQGVSTVLNFFLIDAPLTRPGDVSNVQGGLLFVDGKRKLSFDSYRFPLVAERPNKRNVDVWAMSPEAGKVAVQVRKAAARGKGKSQKRKAPWTTVRKIEVGAHDVFETTLRARGKLELRARVAGTSALPWKVGRK